VSPGLKLPESTLKSDLVILLKSLPRHALNKSTSTEALPPALLADLRYASLRASIRDTLTSNHISALPPPPTHTDISPEQETASENEQKERKRREQALTERQRRVEEDKLKQRGLLRYSKGVLEEGQHEIEQAMRVGRTGLMGHMEVERSAEKAPQDAS